MKKTNVVPCFTHIFQIQRLIVHVYLHFSGLKSSMVKTFAKLLAIVKKYPPRSKQISFIYLQLEELKIKSSSRPISYYFCSHHPHEDSQYTCKHLNTFTRAYLKLHTIK